MPTFKLEHWPREISSAIRKADPDQESNHIVWADTKGAALEAIRILETELKGRTVASRHVLELKGGGRVEADNTKSFSGSHYCVGVWLASGDVPSELTLRAATEQFAELWTPE